MKKTFPFAVALCIALPIGLSACSIFSSEPSESNIKKAIESDIENTIKAQEALLGSVGGKMAREMTPTIHSIKKIGCKQAEKSDKTYNCDVEIEATQMGQKGKGIQNIAFIKGSDGWQVTK